MFLLVEPLASRNKSPFAAVVVFGKLLIFIMVVAPNTKKAHKTNNGTVKSFFIFQFVVTVTPLPVSVAASAIPCPVGAAFAPWSRCIEPETNPALATPLARIPFTEAAFRALPIKKLSDPFQGLQTGR